MRAYKANMIPGGVTPTINVSQYDNDYAVTVTLIEGAEIYTPPAGATIRVEGTKPDGHGFEYPCTYQGNVVTMPIYTQMTVAAGRFPIELVVYQSGLRVGSCNIIFAVERAPLGEGTDISETVIPDIIAGAQAQADAAAASATQAASSAASAETAKDAAMDAAQAAAQSAASLTVDTELSSTSTNPVQNKVIDATVTELKNETTELKSQIGHLQDDGTMRFSAHAFYNRGLDSAGNFNGQTHRVSSREITTATRRMILTPLSGFRFYLYSYAEGSTTPTLDGWKTSAYTMESGHRFKIIIARVTENTSEVADIQTFVNAIQVSTYVTDLSDVVERQGDDIEMLEVEMDYMQSNVLINPVDVTGNYAKTSDQRFGVSGGVVGTTSATGYKYRTGAVIPGHKYTVKSTVGNSLYGYALTDADNRVISIDTQHSSASTFEVTFICPVGASKIHINCMSQYSATVTEHQAVDPILLNTPYKYSLPEYYDAYLDGKIDSIHECERAYGFNGATYAFITDFHYYANKQNSIPLLERIRERTNAVRLIYGGDSVRALGAESYLLSDNYAVAALLASVYDTNYSYIFGNHDYTIATGSSWGEGMASIPIAAVHSIYKKGFSTGIKRNYHYYDDEINEIRHIFIDYTQAGYPWFLEWFRDEALNIPSGWSVAFYCHTPFVANTVEAPSQYMSYLADWICALANKRTYVQTITSTVGGTTYNTDINVDYTASTATVIYAACGHIHKDTLSVVDGVTFFSTTCDAMFQNDGYGRTAGTTDEQAFDVITINKTTKTVNLIRIGAGENRSFTF